MSEEILHIDTNNNTDKKSTVPTGLAKQDHHPEKAKEDSAIDDHETSSPKSEESTMFDDSENHPHELSPTTPIHPEDDENDLENRKEIELQPKATEDDVRGDNCFAKEENVEDVSPQNAASVQSDHPGEESLKEVSSALPSKKIEAEDGHLITLPEDPTPSEKEATLENQQDVRESSNVETEKSPENVEVIPDTSSANQKEQGNELSKDMNDGSNGSEDNTQVLPDGKLAAAHAGPTESEIATQATADESNTISESQSQTNKSPENAREPSKSTPRERETRALEAVKRSRNQFREALNILLQLINENEDDEGTVRLNLVDRDTNLRKILRILGLKLQNLTEAERDLDYVQILGTYESRRGGP